MKQPHRPQRGAPASGGAERLQKILSRAGYGSRRAAEELIAAGRVRVNGQVAALGAKADAAADNITVDGEPIHVRQGPHRYIALYKPRGVISDNVPGGDRRTVLELVPDSKGLYPVGRLDVDSEGLVLLTDDGDLALHLSHPRYEHDKSYDVLVQGEPDAETLERWRRGVMLEDPDGREPPRKTAQAQVTLTSAGEQSWLRVVMHEGRKRQIRRVAQVLGHPALRIVRTRLGPIQLGRLKAGEWRALSPEEVRLLQAVKAAAPPAHRKPRGHAPAARRPPSRGKRTL